MIVGHNHHRLEKRITAALLSGIPYPREAYFLQQMSERLLRRGRDAWLSVRQAQWLHVILNRCEAGTRTSPKQLARPPATTSRSEQLKSDFVQEAINLSDCMETTEVTSLSANSSADVSAAPSPFIASVETLGSLRSS